MEPTGNTRKLGFPLTFNADVESELPDEPEITNVTLEDWTSSSSERVNIVLNVSLEEYIALATCIDVGRDIAYGENSIYLWWIWVRSILSVSLCDSVADCVANDSGVQDAINNLIATNQNIGSGTPDGVSSEVAQSGVLDGLICDEDNIFAAATQIVDLVNTFITDFFERIEAASYLVEVIANILQAIPILDQLGADNIFEFFNNFAEQAQAEYASNFDEALRTQLRCDLFCFIIDNDCTVTWDMLAQFYADAIAFDIYSTFSLESLISFFIGGSFGGSTWVYACYWLVFGVLSLAAKFLTLDFRLMIKLFNSALNDSDSDWEILCDTCGTEFTETLGLRSTDDQTNLTVIYGNQTAGGIATTLHSGEQGAQWAITVPGGRVITRVRLYINRDDNGTNNTGTVFISASGHTVEQHTFSIPTTTLAYYDVDFTSLSIVDTIICQTSTGAATGYINTREAIVEGSGTNPYA